MKTIDQDKIKQREKELEAIKDQLIDHQTYTKVYQLRKFSETNKKRWYWVLHSLKCHYTGQVYKSIATLMESRKQSEHKYKHVQDRATKYKKKREELDKLLEQYYANKKEQL